MTGESRAAHPEQGQRLSRRGARKLATETPEDPRRLGDRAVPWTEIDSDSLPPHCRIGCDRALAWIDAADNAPVVALKVDTSLRKVAA